MNYKLTPCIGVCVLLWTGISLFATMSRQILGAHPLPYTAEVVNMWNYASSPSYTFMM